MTADTPRIEELRRRVQMDPASIAFAALAEEYRKLGRYEEAIETCTAGLQRHPAYLSAHVTLGRALLEVGRYDEAQEELEHVLRVAPENLAAIRGLAEIHHRRGELPEAHAQLERVIHAHESAAPPVAVSAAPQEQPAVEPGAPKVAVAEARIPVSYAAPASEPEAVGPGAPAHHPALDELEAFLEKIVAARTAASGVR